MTDPAQTADLALKQYNKLDERLRHVETEVKVVSATMITWRRLLGVLVAVATIGSTVFGVVIVLGDRLWG